MSLPMDLILEGIVCILLIATIGYCASIDRRLRIMRSGQDGLRDLITDLSAATEQAVGAIARLREASTATGASLTEQVKRGRALADELSLMVEAGNGIADRLGGVEPQRRVASAQMQPATGPRIVATKPAPRGKSESNLLLDLLKRTR